jgi:hypothetical protein
MSFLPQIIIIHYEKSTFSSGSSSWNEYTFRSKQSRSKPAFDSQSKKAAIEIGYLSDYSGQIDA